MLQCRNQLVTARCFFGVHSSQGCQMARVQAILFAQPLFAPFTEPCAKAFQVI
ncbi:hypothetical protein ALP14_200231 [Pseudomonas amygdali pv. myricae]|nr:hypothetical protein ALP14_200231 [Pseudomonas amygdali pv. myricae]